ncbi:MAG: glutamate formimidoyltransferase [Acidobacteria bacterium 13_1_40CM_2_68_10]|nr:MAG: glutamate formimidoyltransferase [Acidobacteria bacterium 13_1_40CM_2_68_10]OLE65351.1 MAG: glutamate formimidoyltransferase [Acidobacteria bacterium 13_1_20CM_2_68_14]
MAAGDGQAHVVPLPPIIESVPNFSEGRRRDVIDAVLDVVRRSGPVSILDFSADPDHNRSVLTLAGAPPAIRAALLALVASCVERIDLRSHQGAHPRMGAVDVIPLVPIRGVRMQDCVALARDLGAAIAARHGLPVYLYEKAATAPHRRNLAEVRKGEFEGFPGKIKDPLWKPDYGPERVHPTAGCVAVGAREFLIAYNINLASSDLDLAKSIARAIREKDGGFPCVKAMGVMLKDRNCAQVSINMTDFRTTPLHVVFDRVREEAARHGVGIAGSEIVGLVPSEALVQAARHYLKLEDFEMSRVLERRLEEAMAGGRAGP